MALRSLADGADATFQEKLWFVAREFGEGVAGFARESRLRLWTD